jgi:hypothetical protein
VGKKYIEKLTKEELKLVFKANNQLQNDVYEDMIDSELHWVGEQLDYIRASLSDWSIGAYNRNYLKVKDNSGFIDGLIEMDKGIPLFSDKEAKQIYEVQELRDRFYEMPSDEDGYEELEEEYEAAVQELAEAVTDKFGQRLDDCSNSEYQLDYFIEFYADARLEEDLFYIDDEDDSYVLFQDIAYIKSYK